MVTPWLPSMVILDLFCNCIKEYRVCSSSIKDEVPLVVIWLEFLFHACCFRHKKRFRSCCEIKYCIFLISCEKNNRVSIFSLIDAHLT